MNFKEWYQSIKRDDDSDEAPCPYIIINGNEHYKLVISELERLGFLGRNDFSKYGLPVTYVDIWYNDFWNSHISELQTVDGDFEFTLDDLLTTKKRDNF